MELITSYWKQNLTSAEKIAPFFHFVLKKSYIFIIVSGYAHKFHYPIIGFVYIPPAQSFGNVHVPQHGLAFFPCFHLHMSMSTIDYILYNSFSRAKVAKYIIKEEVEISLKYKINLGS